MAGPAIAHISSRLLLWEVRGDRCADSFNHRVQIFNREGRYNRQFGSKGHKSRPMTSSTFCSASLASDVHGNLLLVLDNTNRLQGFSPEGKHLCTPATTLG
jgi:hypothetical protein